MSQTTGPILALGAITTANRSVFHDKPMDWRPVVATGLAALAFAGAERMWAQGARMLAYTALVAVCLTRIEPDVPSPVESALAWWEKGGAPKHLGHLGPTPKPPQPKKNT